MCLILLNKHSSKFNDILLQGVGQLWVVFYLIFPGGGGEINQWEKII